MGNRPINRRPWRKKPWAKGRRPTRWNAATNGVNECLVQNITVECAEGGGLPPVVVICDGTVDVEPWADAQEVTVDRVVGDILVYGYTIIPVDGPYSLSNHVPLIKLGMLLDQELSDDGGLLEVPLHNLWDQEHLEDLPWMWLATHQPQAVLVKSPSSNVGGGGTNGEMWFNERIHVDVGVRRKLGAQDALNLYASWASPAPDFTSQVLLFADLRCILMSK